MSLLWILVAFLAFMAVLWSIHTLDDYALARYGYAPFAMPNMFFMLIPHGLLLMIVRDGETPIHVLAALAGVATLGMFLLVRTRTDGRLALFAALTMLLGASVLVLSAMFRGLARAERGKGD